MSFGVFQFRRGTPALWSSVNPVLADGELGIEKGTGLFKIGNGSTAWNSLPYGGIKGDAGINASIAVGSVTTGAAGSNASVSNVGTAQNAILNFTIPRGDVGATGNKGWSPVLAIVSDGERRVLQLTDWVGGEGAKPATGQFLGSSGFVATAASAIDIRGPQGQAGITPTQNTFASVSVGTLPTPTILTADNATDVLMVNAGSGISLTADAATDAFTITNTDTGSASIAAHEAAADPHPQYLTQAEGDALYQAAGQSSGPQMVASIHSATQANTTTTAADLTGMVFTLPPEKTMRIQGNLIFTAAATTTGAFYGFRVAHGAGANGNVQGSWNAEVAITSAAAATGLADGDSINVAGGATAAAGILGTASVAGNNSAWIMLTLVNRSTNANATVALQFRSEVAGSAVTAQIGSSAVAMIG